MAPGRLHLLYELKTHFAMNSNIGWGEYPQMLKKAGEGIDL
jgi:hypothetical protein